MLPLITPQHMLERERAYFTATGVKSIDVMERAAQALAEEIAARVNEGSTLLFACGPGGNGGDGLACARLLQGRYRCGIVLTDAPKSPDAVENLRRAREAGVPVIEGDAASLARPDAWVDAVFGTGLSRAPSGRAAEWIDRINLDRAAGTMVFSCDIPSGLNGATGEAYAPCVQADVTVALSYRKPGELLGDGLDRCGELTARDIGFPDDSFAPFDAWLPEEADLRAWLPPRGRNVHKGDCGHLVIVAGSEGMAGAAAMCASAALRGGAGLVTLGVCRSLVPILQVLCPQAMCVPLNERDGALSADNDWDSLLAGKTAAVVGCGLSRRAAKEAVAAVLESGLPCVVDADAINLIAEHPELAALLRPRHVLTPHWGEARRLLAALDPNGGSTNPAGMAERLTRLGATVVLKSASRLIAAPDDPRMFVSASGGCGMARGGSGDILAGLTGALLAAGRLPIAHYAAIGEPKRRIRPLSPVVAAAAACEIHGRAGALAQQKYGDRAMNAADILEFLPAAFPR